jgi:hypothetical protein
MNFANYLTWLDQNGTHGNALYLTASNVASASQLLTISNNPSTAAINFATPGNANAINIATGGNGEVGIGIAQYPTYALMKQMEVGEAVIDRKIKVIANCIDMIVKGEEVHTTKDLSKKELVDFIEELSESQFKKLEVFVDNFPYFVVDIENSCPKCKTLHSKEYRDFSAFFQ